MELFPYAHANHPDWTVAARQVLIQLRMQMGQPEFASAPTLGLLYITDAYVPVAADILAHLGAELPWVSDWAGTVGIGIASNNVEYFDTPAMAVMLLDLPSDQYRVFSGVAPLATGFQAHTALVHADAATPELGELIEEMAARTETGYLFGGLSSSHSQALQFAVTGDGNLTGYGSANGVFSGGLSGVAFGAQVGLVSRVTQGCKPISSERIVTEVDHNLVLSLDGEPALDVLLNDLGVTLERPHEALAVVRATLVGLVPPPPLGVDSQGDDPASRFGGQGLRRLGNFGHDVVVRHIIGLDPARRGVAVAQQVVPGTELSFCRRNVQAAKSDLVRICAEIREELEPDELTDSALVGLSEAAVASTPHPARGIAGAIYVSCSGRGGPHFGGPDAEMQIVRRALGDVPLVGFFAGGEIAHHHLYGYTGVLTVFTSRGS